MTNAEKYLKDGVSVYELASELYEFTNDIEEKHKYLKGMIQDFFNTPIPPTLTEDERVILRNIKVRGRKAEYIKRTANTGYLQVYSRSGVVGADFANIDIYSHLFQFIKERRRI